MADEGKTAMMPNAALFAAHYLAAMEISGAPADIEARHLALMNNWHSCRLFLEDVASGADLRLYREMVDRNEAARKKAERQKAQDEAAEKARRDAAIRAMGEKVAV